jgi:hypothetical protein
MILMMSLEGAQAISRELAAVAIVALEAFRDDSKKMIVILVEMEQSYLTADFSRKLHQEIEKGGTPASSALD